MTKKSETPETNKAINYEPLLGVVVGKLKCTLGWHKWSYSIQDAINEFGCLPLDNRMPKTAKCDRCGLNNA